MKSAVTYCRSWIGAVLATSLALLVVLLPATAPAQPIPAGDFPAVGVLVDKQLHGAYNCSVLLIGCRTVLSSCGYPSLPGRGQVFFPNAGLFDVEDVETHPVLPDLYGSGLSILKLSEPVLGIAPVNINTAIDPYDYGLGAVGFVVSYNAYDRGVKQSVPIRTRACGRSTICWDMTPHEQEYSPVSPSHSQYGGVLFVEMEDGLVAAGMQYRGIAAINLFVIRDFLLHALAQALDVDDGAACAEAPVVGGNGIVQRSFTEFMTAAGPTRQRHFEVPDGTTELRVVLNSTGPRSGLNAQYGPDLYVGAGASTSAEEFDCSIKGSGQYGACVITSPQPGPWSTHAVRKDLPGVHQMTITLLGAEPGICGNGIREAVEECDGNQTGSCSGACLPSCECDRCGDGLLDFGEQCDDGNTASGDGCATCTIEPIDLSKGGRVQGLLSPLARDRYRLDIDVPSRIHLRLSDKGGNVWVLGMVTRLDGTPVFQFESGQGDNDTYTAAAETYALGPGSYEIVVLEDLPGFDDYTLDVVVRPSDCGDGSIDDGVEECDDGNADAGDGCDTDCVVEAVDIGTGGSFAGGEPGTVLDRFTFHAEQGEQAFLRTLSKDGDCPAYAAIDLFQIEGEHRWPISPETDGPGACVVLSDLRLSEGDYELQISAVDDYYSVDHELPPYTLEASFTLCGDGTIEAPEQCDDGNTAGGDGCSLDCRVEACNRCLGEPSDCTNFADGTPCSDGRYCNGDDQCQAGVCTGGDGSPCPSDGPCDGRCSEALDQCVSECPPPPPPLERCGDGKLKAGEECDDSNLSSGDGCTSSCRVEGCHQCGGEPSRCTAMIDGESCSDGIFCNGSDNCAEGRCKQHTGNPCLANDQCADFCDETYDVCADRFGSTCTAPEGECTRNSCDGLGSCVARPDRQACPSTIACGESLSFTSAGFARFGYETVDLVLEKPATVSIQLTRASGSCTVDRANLSVLTLSPDGTESFALYRSASASGSTCDSRRYFLAAGIHRIRVEPGFFYGGKVAAYALAIQAECLPILSCGSQIEFQAPAFLSLGADEAHVSITTGDASGNCPPSIGAWLKLTEISATGLRVVDVDPGNPRCGKIDALLARGQYVVETVYPSGNIVTRVSVGDCPACGDGTVNGKEACDDANTVAGDGCSPECKVEPCRACDGEPSVCHVLESGSACDDGFFCNGIDACLDGACTNHPGNPCVDGGDCSNRCDEYADTCDRKAGTSCADDGDACTNDECDSGGQCVHPMEARLCTAPLACDSTIVARSRGFESDGFDSFTFEVTEGPATVFPRYFGPDFNLLDLYAVAEDGHDGFLAGTYSDAGVGFDSSEPVFPDVWRFVEPGIYRLYVYGQYGDEAAPYSIEFSSMCARELGCGYDEQLQFGALDEEGRHHVLLHITPDSPSLFARTRVGEADCGDNDTNFVLYSLDANGGWLAYDDGGDFDDIGAREGPGYNRCSRIDHLPVTPGYYLLEMHNQSYLHHDEPYSLDLRLGCRRCGDGAVTAGEQCDDGNTAGGDGCSFSCIAEPCFTCDGEPSACTSQPDGQACSDGSFCNGADSCLTATCSVHAGNPCAAADGCILSCDEGSSRCLAANGTACQPDADPCTLDACSASGTCTHVPDWVTCPAGIVCGSVETLSVVPSSGQGSVEFELLETASGVQIDTRDHDGACTTGRGGYLELFAVLDDGELVQLAAHGAAGSGDCPRIEMRLEGGRYRVQASSLFDLGVPSVRVVGACPVVCGDGLVHGEACDDGNLLDGDGCSAQCEVEPCHQCSGEPSACIPDAGAPCDDGIHCNGPDVCSAGACTVHGGDPCAAGGVCAGVCMEEPKACVLSPGTPCADDGDACTDDFCQVPGVCIHVKRFDRCRAALTCAAPFSAAFEGLDEHAERSVDFDLEAEVAVVTIETGDGTGGCPLTRDTRIQLYLVDADGIASLQADDDDSGVDGCSRIVRLLGGGHYRVSVRSGDGLSLGAYVLTLQTGVCVGCGDSTLSAGEQCDDGNAQSGDGCTDTCQVENCWTCQGSPSSCSATTGAPCDDGLFCNGSDSCSGGLCSLHAGNPCHEAACTSGQCVESAHKCLLTKPTGAACDDADACTAGDVCDDHGTCSGRPTAECGAACGDGAIDFGEECDDGNSLETDGCTSECSHCGDGVVSISEDCDDGDHVHEAGQLCAADCRMLPCGQPLMNGAGEPLATDALFVLRAAVDAAACDPRLCDTDSDGEIDVSDSLRVLFAAVGGDIEFRCPDAVSSTTTVPVTTTSPSAE